MKSSQWQNIIEAAKNGGLTIENAERGYILNAGYHHKLGEDLTFHCETKSAVLEFVRGWNAAKSMAISRLIGLSTQRSAYMQHCREISEHYDALMAAYKEERNNG